MGSTVQVLNGELRYGGLPGETNDLTITQTADSFTVTDSVALTPTAVGCTPVDTNSATCTGVTSVRVNVGNMDDRVALDITAPSTIFGRAGADTISGGAGPDTIEGDLAGTDPPSADVINVRGPGHDVVRCDSQDTVQADPGPDPETDVVGAGCTVDLAPIATIDTGPDPYSSDTSPSFTFKANEGEVVDHFECELVPVDDGPSNCGSPHDEVDLPDGQYTLRVRAFDSPTLGPGPWVTRDFTVDTTSPQVDVTGPVTSATATPTFDFSADEQIADYECAIDQGAFAACTTPYTTPALGNGSYVLFVRGTDLAGNVTTTEFPFSVQTGGGGGGGGGGTPSPPVTPRRIIIESLVLISGRPVKMSRRGVVTIGLQCAGTKKCSGRMTITTAEPVGRKGKKLERLGTTRFAIGANKSRKIKVRFSKKKAKLARRLKRFKAKVVIREVDQRGNARISSRVFVLRAR